MSPVANILDPIQATLAPEIWNDPNSPAPQLKPEIASFIRESVYLALESHGYAKPKEWLNLVLTGSLTTYQYGPGSDCDVSLFIDSEHLPEWSRAEMIGIMIDNVDGTVIPGTPYPLQDFVVGRTLKPTDLYKPGLRSGYDLDANHWIVPPDRNRDHNVDQQENGFYVYALQQADKMDRLLRYEPDKAVSFWHQIHQRRMRDQKAGKGDFSESNIVYKFLANRGLFPKISETSGEYIAKVSDTGYNPWNAEDRQAEDQALPKALRHSEPQKLAQGDEEAQVEPEFPSVQDAQEIHDQAVLDHGQPPAPLLNPGGLESALGRAANHYYYGEGAPQERMADAAGALAHGIGAAQAFKDGNKRTAYHTTRYFLHNNDYGHLSPIDFDDEELADHLIGHGEGTHTLQDTQQMFRNRLGRVGKIAAVYQPITQEEARGNSRPVSAEEFQQLAAEGHQMHNAFVNQTQPIDALDANWEGLKQHAFQQVQKPWGGATYDAHTGIPLESNADRYALTARPPGIEAHSIPWTNHPKIFGQAMDQAKELFRPYLERAGHHFGVFHDNDKGTIDFDPTVVVNSPDEVERLGAYTRALGGAYHFQSGNGYWPPHVVETS